MGRHAAVRKYRQERKDLADKREATWREVLNKYLRSKKAAWLLDNIPTPEAVVPYCWGDEDHKLKESYINASIECLRELTGHIDSEDALILEEAFPSSELFNYILEHYAIPFIILQKYGVQNRWIRYEGYKSSRTFFDVQPHLKKQPDEIQAWFIHGPRKFTLELLRDHFKGDEHGFYLETLSLSTRGGFIGIDDKELQKVGLSFSRFRISRKDVSKLEKLLFEDSSDTRVLLRMSGEIPLRIDRLIRLLDERAYYKGIYDRIHQEESC